MSKKVEIEIFTAEEKLPLDYENVIGAYSEGDDIIEWTRVFYHRRNKCWVDDHGEIETGDITHWYFPPKI